MLLLVMLGVLAVYAQRAPLYTWDLVPYLATVLERADHTPEQLHRETYAHLARVLPPEAYGSLVAGPYAARMAEDAQDFVSQLPMYRVKPGYVWTLRLLYVSGVEPVAAIMLVSLVAGLALIGVLFYSLQRFLDPWLALLATALFIPAARLVDICRVPVPDNLSALLVLLGVLSLSVARWRVAGPVLLVLAVTVRINNIVYVALVLAWLCIAGYRAAGNRIDSRAIGAGSALMASVVGYFAIAVWQGHDWWRLFYHTLVAPVTSLDSFTGAFSLPTWWGVVQSSLQQLLAGGVAVNTVLPLFLLIGLFGLISPRGRRSELSVFIGLFIPTLLVYLLMFPLVPSWDRFFTPFYALVLIDASGRKGGCQRVGMPSSVARRG